MPECVENCEMISIMLLLKLIPKIAKCLGNDVDFVSFPMGFAFYWRHNQAAGILEPNLILRYKVLMSSDFLHDLGNAMHRITYRKSTDLCQKLPRAKMLS